MIGGGDFQNPAAKSHIECRKLLKQADKFVFQKMSDMRNPRHGHSACAVGDRLIAVSGGRIGSGTTCEMYNINSNKWQDLPELNTRRHYHSSCAFEGKQIFVFCGIHNESRQYINSIECLDVSMIQKNMQAKWQIYQLNSSPIQSQFTARQGLGSCQIDKNGILIIGGYTGKHTQDCFYIDVAKRDIKRTDGQLPMPTFPFAVPTLSDVSRNIGFTVDWCTFKLLKFEGNKWNEFDSLRKQ